MNVLIIDKFSDFLLKELKTLPLSTTYLPEITPEQVYARIADYEILVLNSKVRVDRKLVELAPKLKLAIRGGVGMDHFEMDYLAQKGILAKNTAGANAVAVAEQTLGMLLALRHNLIRGNDAVKQFQWPREINRGREVKGKAVGIIGFGHTGSAVAQRLQGFECGILAYDKYKSGFGNAWVKEVQMEEIFERADILSLHVPLTEETHYLVNEDFVKSFKKQIVLLNLARGSVVKLEALIAGLDSKSILGAALDVLENEKMDMLTERQEALYLNLFQRDNVILTPHIGGWSLASRQNISEGILQHIRDLLEKEDVRS